MNPAQPEGFSSPGDSAIVPYGTTPEAFKNPKVPAMRMRGFLWSILGACLVTLSSLLGCLLLGYGMTLILEKTSRKDKILALASSLAALLLSGVVLGSWEQVPALLVAYLIAIATAGLSCSGKATSSKVCLLILVSSCILILCDAALAYWQGTTLPDLIAAVAQSYFDGLTAGSATLSQQEAMSSLQEGLHQFWPLAYGMTAGIHNLVAWVGTRAAQHALGKHLSHRAWLGQFKVPVWVAFVFILALIVSLGCERLIAAPELLSFVSNNLLIASRVVLALGGLAVVDWFCVSKGFGPLGRFCALLAGIWLEFSFMVMTVVGMVDLFGDFRGLRHEGNQAALPGFDSKKSA